MQGWTHETDAGFIPPVSDLDDSAIAGPLGTMALSQVRPYSSTASLRAAKWHADLSRLGIVLPAAVVHDFGLALCCRPNQLEMGPRTSLASLDPRLAATVEAYGQLLQEVRESETARRAPELRMSDDLIVVVLARVLGDVARGIAGAPAYSGTLPLDAAMFERLDSARLTALYRAVDRSFSQTALRTLVQERLFILTMTDALDLDTLKLFGMVGMSQGGALAQVELLTSLETPEANDVVNFSLEILPAVLEAKKKRGGSSSAAFGYSGLGRRGSVDSMVLTELAWEDAELSRRLLDNEVLYYAREQEYEDEAREHLLLIDASASMRGERATFGRAMALATGKKLLLEGERVSARFFDSRLYEPHAARGEDMPTAHLLSFRGERGRNPARVFAELITVLEMMPRDELPVLHLFTHAALYIPREIVARVRQLAEIAAVFMLPSGGSLQLDYLDLLSSHWVVDHAALSQSGERAARARDILTQEAV